MVYAVTFTVGGFARSASRLCKRLCPVAGALPAVELAFEPPLMVMLSNEHRGP
jgi:hypothetical protein